MSSLTAQLSEVEKLRAGADSAVHGDRASQLQAEKQRVEQLRKLHATITTDKLNSTDSKFTF